MIATSRTIEVVRVLHDDRWVTADVVDVVFDNGKVIKNFLRITVKNGGYVGVAARLSDGRFLLTRQCKPVAGPSIEFIAGGRNEGESWEAAGIREMIEETGYRPGKVVYLGQFLTQTDRVDNPCHLFLAFDCKVSDEKMAGDEVQGVEHLLVSTAAVMDLIRRGEIKDCPTLAGIMAHLLFERGLTF